ncbi:uroporphyrinogen-III synthase [Blastochloris sulfoviridis]|uniref:Tetrapyrrole biosynthesis uroporphyrinogen III synthase domain-containing protein n=1 Tax=Blastochloris sulfoviridis TaxID=50712 RepID=A0A5M6I6B9_9HYPH|nr:uroporphyrinogen-III synthase [Blastochloris sulfoviridis]KAA5603289.1 hypothetical protein F1193_01135 [Blastochloris sulfoviridis]
MRLLVTRPEPGASRTRAALAAHGHEALLDPLMTIVPVAPSPPANRFDAVALTSVNGARAAAELAWVFYSGLPVFTVGRRTREVAIGAGFTDVTSAEGDVGDLADMLAKCLIPGERVLWLAGEDRAGDLAAELAPRGIAVETVVAYRAEPAQHLAEATLAALSAGRIDGILHYSRRSCETLLAAGIRDGVYDAVVGLQHYALSPRVAEPLVASGAVVRIAATPDEGSLLDLLPFGRQAGDACDVTRGRTAMASQATDDVPNRPGQTPTEPAPKTETEAIETDAASAKATSALETIPSSADDTRKAAAGPAEIEVAAIEIAETSASPAGEAPVAAEAKAPETSEETKALEAPAQEGSAQETQETKAQDTKAQDTEAQDTEEPESKAPEAKQPVSAPPPSRGRGGAIVGGTFAGLLAGAVAAGALTYTGILPPLGADPGPLLEAQARLQATEARLSALESRPEPAPAPAPTAPAEPDPAIVAKLDQVEVLATRIAELERAAQALSRLDARIAALETQARETESAPAAGQPAGDDTRVSALQTQVKGLETKIDGAAHGAEEAIRLATTAGEAAQRAAAAATPLPDQLAAIDRKLAELSSLPGRVVALDQRLQLAAAPSRMIAWPVALGALRTALDEGRPFRAEYDAAMALAGPGYERLKAIDGVAASGVPTLRQVQGRFDDLVSQLLSNVPRDEPANDIGAVLNKLARSAEGLVRFRPTPGMDGETPAALVGRVQSQLSRGDLAGAIATVGQLPPDLVKIATPWLQIAKTRLDADRLLAELTDQALAALARTGG